MTQDEALRANLAEDARQMGTDELRVLTYISARLLVGQRQYGRLDLRRDTRSWKRERDQELADAIMYVAFEALKGRE